MKNALQTSSRIKALADYLADNDNELVEAVPDPQKEDSLRQIGAIREELDRLAEDARTSTVTYFQFQTVLDRLEATGAEPPSDIVSDIRSNLFEH